VLFAAIKIQQINGKKSGVILLLEQGAEYRVAVEARKAAPDDAGTRIDQRTDRAIADQGEIEVLHAFYLGVIADGGCGGHAILLKLLKQDHGLQGFPPADA